MYTIANWTSESFYSNDRYFTIFRPYYSRNFIVIFQITAARFAYVIHLFHLTDKVYYT